MRRRIGQPDSGDVRAPAVAHRDDGDALAAYDDLDLREIGRVLWRKRAWIIIPTIAAALIAFVIVNMMTPRYKSEARIFIDGRENIFLRPNADRVEDRAQLDQEAVTSQVQLILSRDLARLVVKKEKLADNPEFDPVLRGVSPLKAVLSLFGIGRDPFKMTPEERVLDAYYERITAYAVDKSRVIAIEFQSRDPELAARVTNAVAEGYLALQQAAKQQQAKDASAWLAGEIDALRKRVTDAEQRVEEFRGKSNLLVGTNNTTLSSQQLGEINSQLASARAQKADAEARSRFIRNMLKTGQSIEASDVLNSELIRRLSEQRVTLRAQLAEQSSTLLGNHPRIKELRAQIFDLDRQIREEAAKLARGLETEAQIAGARVESLSGSLDQLKTQVASSSGDDVKLRALEREARSQRDLLESYLAKYREASARESIDAAPADARIISRAIVSNTPAYPKKLPIVLIATLAALMLSGGIIAAGELLRMTSAGSPRRQTLGASLSREAPPMNALAERLLAEDIGDLVRRIEAEDGGHSRILLVTIGRVNAESIATAFARAMARRGSAVLIDLAGATPATDDAPGLYNLVTGSTSFSRIVTRDTASPLHIVSAGEGAVASAVVASPKTRMAIEALSRVYDRLMIHSAMLDELPDELGRLCHRAIVILDANVHDEALAQAQATLATFGIAEVGFLADQSLAVESGAGRSSLRNMAATLAA